MFNGSAYAYYAMYVVGFAIMMVINLFRHNHYGISKLRAVLMTLFTYISGVCGAMIMGKAFSAVANAVNASESSRVAIFGAVIFCPMFLLAMFFASEKLLDAPKSCWRDNMDMLTPGIFIILLCAKFGCFLNGCCYGFHWEYGIYNRSAEAKVFPVQIFEVISMIAVLWIADRLTYKSKTFVKGTAYPITASLYCVTRFGWEFARYYSNRNLRYLFLGMSLWQLCCVLVIAVSVALIFILKSEKIKQKDLQKAMSKKQKSKRRK